MQKSLESCNGFVLVVSLALAAGTVRCLGQQRKLNLVTVVEFRCVAPQELAARDDISRAVEDHRGSGGFFWVNAGLASLQAPPSHASALKKEVLDILRRHHVKWLYLWKEPLTPEYKQILRARMHDEDVQRKGIARSAPTGAPPETRSWILHYVSAGSFEASGTQAQNLGSPCVEAVETALRRDHIAFELYANFQEIRILVPKRDRSRANAILRSEAARYKVKLRGEGAK